MALACFGIDAGLSEQQIVDLIIHHRVLHKHKLRTRLDYYQRTIAKAAKRTGFIDTIENQPPNALRCPHHHQRTHRHLHE